MENLCICIKTCVKWSQKDKIKILMANGNEGQTYYKMLPLDDSAMLVTCIKRLFVLKNIFGLFESGRFTQVLLYTVSIEGVCADKHTHLL